MTKQKKRCRKHEWRSADGQTRYCIHCNKKESMFRTKKEWEQFQREIDDGLWQ